MKFLEIVIENVVDEEQININEVTGLGILEAKEYVDSLSELKIGE